MPDEVKPPEEIEVSKAEQVKGTVRFMSDGAFANPAPTKMKLVIRTIQTFSASMVTLVGATDIFSGKQAKVMAFCLGAFYLLCEALLKSTGVESAADTKKRLGQ